MTLSDENLKEIQDELKWVTIRESQSFTDKLMARGVIGLLVPVGFIVTTGVLLSGMYNLVKKDSRKQQLYMRYRVVAQGATVLLAVIGATQMKFST